MLHTQDCTVIELGHSGWVPSLWDKTSSVQSAQHTSLASWGQYDVDCSQHSKQNRSREDGLSLISQIRNGFSDQKGRRITTFSSWLLHFDRGYPRIVLACWPRRLYPETPADLRLAWSSILSKCVSARTRCVPAHMDIILAHTVYDETTAAEANSKSFSSGNNFSESIHSQWN